MLLLPLDWSFLRSQALPKGLPLWCLLLLSKQISKACERSSPSLKGNPDVRMSFTLVVSICVMQWHSNCGSCQVSIMHATVIILAAHEAATRCLSTA